MSVMCVQYQRKLPALAERAGLDLEGPGRRTLLREPEADLRYVVRLDEERVRLVGHALPGPGKVDDAVHDDERDMDAQGPERARHRLREVPLRAFCRGERRRLRASLPCRGRADEDDAPAPGALHGRDHLLGSEESAEGIDTPSAFEVRGRRLLHRAPDPGACVVDEDLRIAQVAAD